MVPTVHTLSHAALNAVHSEALARPSHPLHPHPAGGYLRRFERSTADCGGRGGCYENRGILPNPYDYCSEATPAIERLMYCDGVRKSTLGGP